MQLIKLKIMRRECRGKAQTPALHVSVNGSYFCCATVSLRIFLQMIPDIVNYGEGGSIIYIPPGMASIDRLSRGKYEGGIQMS
jgi:hypothetical protein